MCFVTKECKKQKVEISYLRHCDHRPSGREPEKSTEEKPIRALMIVTIIPKWFETGDSDSTTAGEKGRAYVAN